MECCTGGSDDTTQTMIVKVQPLTMTRQDFDLDRFQAHGLELDDGFSNFAERLRDGGRRDESRRSAPPSQREGKKDALASLNERMARAGGNASQPSRAPAIPEDVEVPLDHHDFAVPATPRIGTAAQPSLQQSENDLNAPHLPAAPSAGATAAAGYGATLFGGLDCMSVKGTSRQMAPAPDVPSSASGSQASGSQKDDDAKSTTSSTSPPTPGRQTFKKSAQLNEEDFIVPPTPRTLEKVGYPMKRASRCRDSETAEKIKASQKPFSEDGFVVPPTAPALRMMARSHSQKDVDPVSSVLAFATARVAEKANENPDWEADENLSTAPPSTGRKLPGGASSEGLSDGSETSHRSITESARLGDSAPPVGPCSSTPARVTIAIEAKAKQLPDASQTAAEARPLLAGGGKRTRSMSRMPQHSPEAGVASTGQPADDGGAQKRGQSADILPLPNRRPQLGRGLPSGGHAMPSLLAPAMQLGTKLDDLPPPPPERRKGWSASSLAAQLALHTSIPGSGDIFKPLQKSVPLYQELLFTPAPTGDSDCDFS